MRGDGGRERMRGDRGRYQREHVMCKWWIFVPECIRCGEQKTRCILEKMK